MKNRAKLAATAAFAVAIAGAGTGTAFAASSHTVKHTIVTPGATSAESAGTSAVADPAGGPDVQQGDQTTPDVTGSGGDAATASTANIGTTAAAPGGTANDSAGTPVEANTESGSPSGAAEPDGPGGHADPTGNVDHQFNGNE